MKYTKVKIDLVDSMLEAGYASNLINTYNNLKHHIDAPGIFMNHYIAKDGNKVIGVIGYRIHEWFMCEICHLSIDPKYRRQGVGIKLVRYLLSKKIKPLYVATVYKTNKKAQAFFKKLEFKRIAQVKKEYVYIKEVGNYRT